MLSQLTVFMQNKEGRLTSLCNTLAQNDINMHSLYIADTFDFGVARIFCDTPQAARKLLNAAGYRVMVTPVIGVKVPNVKGGLAELMNFLDSQKVNIEYAYCFSSTNAFAIDVLKVDVPDFEDVLRDAGYQIVEKEEIYAVD